MVKRGQVLAHCGNSGAPGSNPHLHFALMDDAGVRAVSRPARFTNYLVLDGGRMAPVAVGSPLQDQFVQPGR